MLLIHVTKKFYSDFKLGKVERRGSWNINNSLSDAISDNEATCPIRAFDYRFSSLSLYSPSFWMSNFFRKSNFDYQGTFIDEMEPIVITLQVVVVNEDKIDCQIFTESENNLLSFFVADDAITLFKENQLALNIRNNKHQLRKIIRSAIKGNIHVGQIIKCVFIEEFKFLKDDHFSKFIRIDRRNGNLDITTSDSGFSEIHKIYADGSFNCETKQSGYGGFIEAPDGKQELFSRSFMGGSNNLMELLAVTDGLHRLFSEKSIQVHTDSRFVIRGLVQWVHFWKHNNWQTAYGRDVKYANYWQQAYNLCEGKFIEFKWIKGHSGNLEQDFCHQLAKESTTR